MKVFIFDSVNKLTDSYHCGGGLVVVAEDKEQALRLIASQTVAKVSDEEWDAAIVHDLVGEPESAVYVFPDAGCC